MPCSQETPASTALKPGCESGAESLLECFWHEKKRIIGLKTHFFYDIIAETSFSVMPWETGVTLCRRKAPRKCSCDLPNHTSLPWHQRPWFHIYPLQHPEVSNELCDSTGLQDYCPHQKKPHWFSATEVFFLKHSGLGEVNDSWACGSSHCPLLALRMG